MVIPLLIRRKFHMKTGDVLEAQLKKNCILLIPHLKPKRKPRIQTSKITGMPVLNLGTDAPKISNDWVRENLSDFP